MDEEAPGSLAFAERAILAFWDAHQNDENIVLQLEEIEGLLGDCFDLLGLKRRAS